MNSKGLHRGNDINPYSTHSSSIFVKFCKLGKAIDDPFKSAILLKIKICRIKLIANIPRFFILLMHKIMKMNTAVIR